MIARLISGVLALGILALTGCQVPVESIRQQADASYARADYLDAANGYGRIADRYPGDWEAQYRYGLCLLRMERYADARQALEIAFTRRPGEPIIADALAETIYRQEDLNRLFSFLRAEASRTHSVDAYRRLGHYAMLTDDPDAARAAIESAILVDEGRTPGPYLDAAALAERVGDLDEAVRRLRQAYGIAPSDPGIQARLRELGEIPGPTSALPPG